MMNTKEAFRTNLNTNRDILLSYLSDLSDADLLVRPVPDANHIAWQLGHLIVGEMGMMTKVPGTKPVELPAGFAERHSNDSAKLDPPTGFATKDEYIGLLKSVRSATLAALDTLTEADFDKPSGLNWAPTLGVLFAIAASHDMMHGGQFTVVRRKLGKPVVF
jgi:hypothetical protein